MLYCCRSYCSHFTDWIYDGGTSLCALCLIDTEEKLSILLPNSGLMQLLLRSLKLSLKDWPPQDAPAECLKRCMDLIKNGASVLFFTEGTRSKDGKLGDFKKGAFSVAAKTGMPVIPMTLIGTGQIMPAGMEGVINSGSVKAVIHKPIEGSDPEILCQVARNTILDMLKRQG
ncbi:hypothetical protein REPUB_Repub18cG0156900 [Reevesia pubescens]